MEHATLLLVTTRTQLPRCTRPLNSRVEERCAVVRFRGICGACSTNDRTLRSIGLRVSSNRFTFVINTSNTKGDAFLGLVVQRRAPASNRIVIGGCHLSHLGHGRIPCFHHAVNVIFRSFHLVGAVAICRGITFSLQIVNGNGQRVDHHIRRILRLVSLLNGDGHCPPTLSNNRRRHINLTQTLIGGPTLVVTSRPANGMSPRVSQSVIRLLARVGRQNAAILVIARRRSLMRRFGRQIVALRSNHVISSAGNTTRPTAISLTRMTRTRKTEA